MNNTMNKIYYKKYIKYKNKYLNLKHINDIQKGGIKACITENPKAQFKSYIWNDIGEKLQTIDNRYLYQIGRLDNSEQDNCNLWIWMKEYEKNKNKNHIDFFMEDLKDYEYNEENNTIKLNFNLGYSVTKNNIHNFYKNHIPLNYPDFTNYEDFINYITNIINLFHIYHFEPEQYSQAYYMVYGAYPYTLS